MQRKISEQQYGELLNKKILLALIGFSLLACNFLFPPKGTPAPETNKDVVPISENFTIVRLHPSDGDLKTLLASEAQKAATLGQMPVVEFDATWCPPCKAIDEGINEKNKLMLDAYDGAYIIKPDVDEWGWENSQLHDFDFDGIPVYFKLDADGNPTGQTVDGNAWGDNIPENIAPVMDKFFHAE
jgi:thiol-disulfide isomerase/thioredoxin